MQRYNLFFFIFFHLFSVSGQESKELQPRESKASFYHDALHGLVTSNGESYDRDDFTGAHLTYPFNTILLITNKKNSKSVIVRINDRGPYIRSRAVDLSYSAAKKLGMVSFGVVPVRITELKFLDSFPLEDSILNDKEIRDCYGNQKTLNKTTVYIWQSENWKHAFYMASSLALDYNTDSIVILISGEVENRKYSLLYTGIVSSSDSLIKTLKSDGFSHAKLFTGKHQEDSRHTDR